MSRVSEVFFIDATQGGLDFVDVDVSTDVPVYIDPGAIRAQDGLWIEECQQSLQSFFGELLAAIARDDKVRIGDLIFPLVEPNETHLGSSVGNSRGIGLGNRTKAAKLIDALRTSKAAKSGFLRDLDDTALLVPGVDRDIVSDITTSVIRAHLIEYTQNMARFHEIPMEQQQSGPYWDASTKKWEEGLVDLPRAENDKLLLVPKSIVRANLTVDKGKYYRGYLRPYYEQMELNDPSSDLVRILKNKKRKVDLGRLDERLGTNKAAIVNHTESFPSALREYRANLDASANAPLADEELHNKIATPRVNVRDLLDSVKAIAPGPGGATLYHRAVAKLFTALFDTSLANMAIEQELHVGLKRIDIRFDNVASDGFFAWLGKHYPSAFVVVECKNYGKEVGNPEFDQLAMRFAPTRGQVGILAVRTLDDREKAFARAKAIADDGHGYVIVLDDTDLEDLVGEYETQFETFSLGPRKLEVVRAQFEKLVGF
ncbi:hypothetical protein I8920_00925 [Curtobacterium sp. YC1]|uniref:hypothetical protein n=1 Tax=Curtobacterium sp. YC1 TaxID=2795488 RepID=UPI0018E5861E|nr:hypothetical protein [Curtobacterium sp. YC1]QQD76373.1 hypothetical protein I8920_00925 [Curtobacterium sp. YC1]